MKKNRNKLGRFKKGNKCFPMVREKTGQFAKDDYVSPLDHLSPKELSEYTFGMLKSTEPSIEDLVDKIFIERLERAREKVKFELKQSMSRFYKWVLFLLFISSFVAGFIFGIYHV